MSPGHRQRLTGTTEPSFGKRDTFPTIRELDQSSAVRALGRDTTHRQTEWASPNDRDDHQLRRAQPNPQHQQQLAGAARSIPGHRHTLSGSSTTTLQPVTPEGQIIRLPMSSYQLPERPAAPVAPAANQSSSRATRQPSTAPHAPSAKSDDVVTEWSPTPDPYRMQHGDLARQHPTPPQAPQAQETTTTTQARQDKEGGWEDQDHLASLPLRFWPLEARQAIGLGGLQTPIFGPPGPPPPGYSPEGGVSLPLAGFPPELKARRTVSPASLQRLQQQGFVNTPARQGSYDTSASRAGLPGLTAQHPAQQTDLVSHDGRAQQETMIQRGTGTSASGALNPHDSPSPPAFNPSGPFSLLSSARPRTSRTPRSGTFPSQPVSSPQFGAPGTPSPSTGKPAFNRRASRPLFQQPPSEGVQAVRDSSVKIFPRTIFSAPQGEADFQGFLPNTSRGQVLGQALDQGQGQRGWGQSQGQRGWGQSQVPRSQGQGQAQVQRGHQAQTQAPAQTQTQTQPPQPTSSLSYAAAAAQPTSGPQQQPPRSGDGPNIQRGTLSLEEVERQFKEMRK